MGDPEHEDLRAHGEGADLRAHVAACSERYKTIFNRLARIERIMLGTAAGVIGLLVKIAYDTSGLVP